LTSRLLPARRADRSPVPPTAAGEFLGTIPPRNSTPAGSASTPRPMLPAFLLSHSRGAPHAGFPQFPQFPHPHRQPGHTNSCGPGVSGLLSIFWAPVPGPWPLSSSRARRWPRPAGTTSTRDRLGSGAKRMARGRFVMPLFRAVRTKRSQPGIMRVMPTFCARASDQRSASTTNAARPAPVAKSFAGQASDGVPLRPPSSARRKWWAARRHFAPCRSRRSGACTKFKCWFSESHGGPRSVTRSCSRVPASSDRASGAAAQLAVTTGKRESSDQTRVESLVCSRYVLCNTPEKPLESEVYRRVLWAPGTISLTCRARHPV